MLPIRDINPTRITPVFTLIIIAANVVAFLLLQPSSEEPATIPPFGDAATEFLYEQAAIACELTTGEPLTVAEATSERCVEGSGGRSIFPEKNVYLAAVVSMFLHAGGFHIFGNMWFLWIFGNNVEEAFGTVGYLLLYLVAGVAATATFVLANTQATVPMIGASGAIAGVLGAYLVLFPTHRILTLFLFFFAHVGLPGDPRLLDRELKE